jgi:hypothetical protein
MKEMECCVNDTRGLLTALHFLRNLKMCPLSWSVTLHSAGKIYQGQRPAYWARLTVINIMKHCDYDTRDHVHNTSFSLYLKNGLIKLECYITLCWKGLPGTNLNLLGSFVNYEENEVL